MNLESNVSVIAQLEKDRSEAKVNLALAEDPRMAKYLEELPQNLEIQNVILDHDGTISTLREG